CNNVTPGDYTVTETDPTPGFDLTALTCSGGGADTSGDVPTRTATIGLDAGESITCTFTNTQRGSITIVKDTVPNGETDLSFTDDLANGGVVGPRYHDSDATLSNQVVCNNVTPGDYTVTETDPTPGFDLTALTCSGGGADTSGDVPTRTATIGLDAGESITCTFTNTQRGSITIVKDTVPNGGTDFSFTDDIGNGCVVGPLDDDSDATLSNQVVCNNVTPGDYTVTETDPTPGFDLTALTCSGGGADTSGDVPTRTATIGLDAGESITCTFTNTQRGSITIVKDTVPNGETDLSFTDDLANGGVVGPRYHDSDATLSNQVVCNNVTPGDYTVTETDPTPGFDLTALTCSGGGADTSGDVPTRTATIGLDAGESITCTFTNTQRGSITIVKDTVPNGGTDFSFTDDIGNGCVAGPLDDDSDATLSNQVVCNNVTPGDYTVTETDPTPGFDLTALTCSGGGADTSGDVPTRTATIGLDAGE